VIRIKTRKTRKKFYSTVKTPTKVTTETISTPNFTLSLWCLVPTPKHAQTTEMTTRWTKQKCNAAFLHASTKTGLACGTSFTEIGTNKRSYAMLAGESFLACISGSLSIVEWSASTIVLWCFTPLSCVLIGLILQAEVENKTCVKEMRVGKQKCSCFP
jgi:hypothetical protein